MNWQDCNLYLIFTPALCRDAPWETLDAALTAGVDLVQWRVPAGDDTGLSRCLDLCTARSVPLIVNDDVPAATRYPQLAGAHVGQDDLHAPVARRQLARNQILGVSTHDHAQVDQAVKDGADYLGIGPCFPTATKGYTHGLDRSVLREVIKTAQRPTFAIGGITEETLPELLELGCRRIAVSQAILGAPDAEQATARLREKLRAG